MRFTGFKKKKWALAPRQAYSYCQLSTWLCISTSDFAVSFSFLSLFLHFSGGSVAGIVFGVLFTLLLLVGAVFLIIRRYGFRHPKTFFRWLRYGLMNYRVSARITHHKNSTSVTWRWTGYTEILLSSAASRQCNLYIREVALLFTRDKKPQSTYCQLVEARVTSIKQWVRSNDSTHKTQNCFHSCALRAQFCR